MAGAELLRELMRRRGWTQDQAAAAFGVTRNAVNRWTMTGEHARTMPGPAERLARAYLRDDALDPAHLDG